MVHGVGQKKLEDFGEEFLRVIQEHCAAEGISMDIDPPASAVRPPRGMPTTAAMAFPHFDAGKSVAEVAKLMGRAESTTRGYLHNYIQVRRVTDATRWVDEKTVATVREAILEHGVGPLKPIFVALEEKVSYDDIRIVMACMANEDAS
jgi:ATP-dependent DNA helicase RecQ